MGGCGLQRRQLAPGGRARSVDGGGFTAAEGRAAPRSPSGVPRAVAAEPSTSSVRPSTTFASC